MSITALKKITDAIEEKFGKGAYLELYADNSGGILYFYIHRPDKLLAEFDSLEELIDILKTEKCVLCRGIIGADHEDLCNECARDLGE